MEITLIQMDIAWGNPQANHEAARQLMLSAEPSDLYVLPEMWSTGYNVEPREVAEGEDGETLRWMQRMADKLDAAVAGSIAVRLKDGTFRNRLYFVTPSLSQPSLLLPPLRGKDSDKEGEAKPDGRKESQLPSAPCLESSPTGGSQMGVFYDKHHLFSYGHEATQMRAS